MSALNIVFENFCSTTTKI